VFLDHGQNLRRDVSVIRDGEGKKKRWASNRTTTPPPPLRNNNKEMKSKTNTNKDRNKKQCKQTTITKNATNAETRAVGKPTLD
jgi:hypothetical protein